jgi:hypothetical protein
VLSKEEDKACKHIIWEVRAQRCAQKKFVGKTLIYQRSKYNALWSICMYTYLRNICSFSLWTFFIFKSLILYRRVSMAFRFCLLKSQLMIFTSGNGMISTDFFAYKPLSQSSLALPLYFLFF